MTDRELAQACLETAQRLADLATRLAEPPPPPRLVPRPEDEALITPDELAVILKVSRPSVYSLARRKDWQPYIVRAGRKVLRFKRGLLGFLQRNERP